MNTIIHPSTKQVYNLYSKQGKQLLKKFIFSYNHLKKTGGSEEGMDKEMKRLKDTELKIKTINDILIKVYSKNLTPTEKEELEKTIASTSAELTASQAQNVSTEDASETKIEQKEADAKTFKPTYTKKEAAHKLTEIAINHLFGIQNKIEIMIEEGGKKKNSKKLKKELKDIIDKYLQYKKNESNTQPMTDIIDENLQDDDGVNTTDTKIDSNESLSSNEQEINSPVNIQTDDNIKSNTQPKPSNLSFLNIPDDSSDEENEDSSEDSGEDSREDSTEKFGPTQQYDPMEMKQLSEFLAEVVTVVQEEAEENFHRTIEKPEETDIIAELLTVASDEWEKEFPKDTYGTELPFEKGEEVEIDLPFWEVNELQQTHKAEIIKIDKIKKTATLKYDNSDEGPEYLEHYQEVPLSKLIKINFFDFNVGEEVEFYTEDSRWEKARIMRIETEIKEVTLRPYVSEIIDVDETDENFKKKFTEINKNDLAKFRYTKDSNWEKAVIVNYDSENKKVSLRLVGEEIGVVPQFIRKIEK